MKSETKALSRHAQNEVLHSLVPRQTIYQTVHDITSAVAQAYSELRCRSQGNGDVKAKKRSVRSARFSHSRLKRTHSPFSHPQVTQSHHPSVSPTPSPHIYHPGVARHNGKSRIHSMIFPVFLSFAFFFLLFSSFSLAAYPSGSLKTSGTSHFTSSQ